MQDATDKALAQAKASGEFDGADGAPGKDGADGQPGENGTDGYSPTANVTQNENGATIIITDKNGTTTATVTNGKDGADGKDGAPGADGQDGITPTIGANGNWYLGDTDTGKPSRGEMGQQGPAGNDGADGAPGKDGTSATHSWNGTVLTITSASGTSSADLKGEKGDKWGTGAQGPKGEKGDTGAGMDITGAAVGQIAKITAVDESGKPIAWEAVDMPSGGGGVTTLHINVTAVNVETMEATFTADKTPSEMQQASANGPVWCVATFAAGIIRDEAVSVGAPPAWYSVGVVAFGSATADRHNDNGNNRTGYAVMSGSDGWLVDLTAFFT